MKRRVFAFNYVLKGADGQQLDASDAGEPLAFLEGTGQIIPKLEEEVISMKAGDKKNVKLAAKEAYGEPDPKMKMDVPKEELAHLKLEVGAFLQLNLGEQTKVVRVATIGDKVVTLDGNHPLAGVDLVFDIEMVAVREATAEELQHGHAHGAHGHGHHH
ncbi:FKBP-type peptidyl-prolyl cis-trans isomerase [Bdellovibrio sp. HCB337]|uniref:FKBP-type peptidyl-prolyl cis-trans isomerase n=1 Tax=Bdellovibrio sp. HCB337 TaxID=3394358 RepID=UPI0039A4DF3F